MAQVRLDTLRTVAAASITSSYTALGVPLAVNWRIMRIINNTNGDLLFSLDGTTNQMLVPAGGFVLYDLSTNAQNVMNMDTFVFAVGTQFYVKTSTSASTGAVWLEGVYATGV